MAAMKLISPGEVLQEEFLGPMDLSAERLARGIHLSSSQVRDIMDGRARISADISMRLSIFFGTTPQFWQGLQDQYDLDELEASGKTAEYEKIVPAGQMRE